MRVKRHLPVAVLEHHCSRMGTTIPADDISTVAWPNSTAARPGLASREKP
jgi:hypothetical protein